MTTDEPLYWVEDPRTGKKRQYTGEQLVKQVELLELSTMSLQSKLGRYKDLAKMRMIKLKKAKAEIKRIQDIVGRLSRAAHGGGEAKPIIPILGS